MKISEQKLQIVINNYSKDEIDPREDTVYTAYEKGFRRGVQKVNNPFNKEELGYILHCVNYLNAIRGEDEAELYENLINKIEKEIEDTK